MGSTSPQSSTAYYEDSAFIPPCADLASTWNCTPWTQGFEAVAPAAGAFVVLDIGAPCFVPASGAYGTQLFDERTCTPMAQEIPIVSGFLRGYEAGHTPWAAPAILAVGVSNSLTAADPQSNYALTTAQLAQHAQLMYTTLVAGRSVPGPVRLTVWGAADIEQSSDGNWYGPGDTRAWVDGYAAAAGITLRKPGCTAAVPGMLADFGDDVVGNGGWSAADIYYVAWGAPVSCAVPEIYYTVSATEWANLNRWASSTGQPPIQFTAVMSENDATGGDLTASGSWNALHSATGQAAPYVTSIVWSRMLGWHHAAYAGYGPLAGPPQAVTWGAGHADVFWRGTDGSLWHAWYIGGRWAGPQSLGGSLAGDPSAVSWGPGHIDVFWKGTDTQLWHVYYADGWHGPERLGGGPLGSPPHADTDQLGSIDVFWAGTDGNLWRMGYAGGWSVVPRDLGGGPLASDPQPVATATGAETVLWTGSDRNVWRMEAAGDTWRGPDVIHADGDVRAAPSPVSWGGGHLDVFWPRSDGSIWHSWVTGAGGLWTGPVKLTDAAAASRMTSLSFGFGHLQVFWEDTAGNLVQDEYANGWLGATDLGDGPIASPPAAVPGGDGFVDVFWRGTDPNASLWHDWHP